MPYVTGNFESSPLSIYDQDGITFRTLTTDGSANTYLVKYDNNLNVDWATKMGIIFGNSYVTTDSFNNVYFSGSYDSDDPSGPVYLYNQDGTTGYTIIKQPGGSRNIVLSKYGATGSVTWGTTIQGSGSGAERIYSIKPDKNNNVYLFLTSSSNPIQIYNQGSNTPTPFNNTRPSGKNNAVLIKYNDNGYYDWGTYIYGENNIVMNDGAIDSSNNIYMSGRGATAINVYNKGDTLQYYLPTTNSFIIKYSDTGFVQWENYIGSTYAGNLQINSTITDTSNNLYITGSYGGNGVDLNLYNQGSTAIVKTFPLLFNSDNDTFLVKYSDTGYVQWGTHISGLQNKFGYSVNLDSFNQPYLSGIFSNEITFYNKNDTSDISISGNTPSSFVAKYSDTGYCQWATKMSGTINQYINTNINSMTIQNNNIYVGVYTDLSGINIYNQGQPGIAKTLTTGSTGVNYNNSFLVKYSDTGYVKYATALKSSGNNTVTNLSYIPAIQPEYDQIKNTIQFDYPENYGLTGIDIYELSGNNITNSIQLRGNKIPTSINGVRTVDISGTQLMGPVTNPYVLNTINSNPHQFYLGILGDNNFIPTLPFTCSDNETLPTIGTPVFNGTNLITFGNTGTGFGTINQIDLYKVAQYTNGDRYISHSAQDVSFNPSTYSIDITGITLKSETSGPVINVENGNYYLGMVRAPTPQNLGVTFYISDFFDISGVVIANKNYVYVSGSYANSNLTLFDENGVGHTTLGNSGNADAFIAKYSDTGYVQWATRIAGTNYDAIESITIDKSNNAYVIGNYNSATLFDSNGVGHTTLETSGNADGFIAKYSDTGYVQWATRIAGTGADNGNSITTDKLNNVYVTGYYTNSILTLFDANGVGHTTLGHSGNIDGFIAKYSDTGYVQWATRISGTGADNGKSITTDNSNNAYVTGYYSNSTTLFDANGVGHTTLGNSGGYDGFIAKYSDTGYLQWATRIAGTGDDNGNSITTDKLNNIYVTGSYSNSTTLFDANGVGHTTLENSGNSDVFIAKYSDTGYVQWATRIAGSGYDSGNSITTDNSNNAYVTGYYSNSTTLFDANGVGHTTLGNSGNADGFIAKYSDTGYLQWATRIAGSTDDFGYSITTDKLNNIYVSGSYGSTAFTLYDINGYGHTTLGNSNPGYFDAFIAKYSDTGYVQWATHMGGTKTDYGFSISASK